MQENTITPSAESRIPALDGLRGIAILVVLVRHMVDGMDQSTMVDRLVYQFGRLGSNGVDLFFVLSGFLITGILLDTRSRPDYLRRFYLRRTLRIFPLYYLTLFIAIFVLPMFFDTSKWQVMYDAWETQAWHWSYLSNWHFALKGHYGAFHHFWSLAVEEQFYLVWPAVVLLAGPRRLRSICIGALCVAFITRLVCALTGVSTLAMYVMTVTRLDGLAIGSLLALLVRSQVNIATTRIWGRVTVIGGLSLLLGLVWYQWGMGRTTLVVLAGSLPVALVGGAVLWLAVTGTSGSLLTRSLSHPLPGFFGRYSYGLYVIHPWIFEGVFRVSDDSSIPSLFGSLLPGRIVFGSIALMLSILLALVSWHGWEKQWQKLRNRPGREALERTLPASDVS